MRSLENKIEFFFERIRLKPFWFLFVLILINVAIKYFQLSDESLWLDEASTADYSIKTIPEILSNSAKEQNPPLYFIIMHFWTMIFGISEFGLRSFSMLLSVVTVVILFLFAKRNFNIQTAIISSLLFTFSEQQIYFSVEARVYTLIGLLSIVSFNIYYRLLNKPGLWKGVLLGIVNALLIYCHFISCFIILVQAIYSIVIWFKPERKMILYEIISMLITFIIFIPWISHLTSNIPKVGEYWLGVPTFYNLKGLFISFSNGKIMTVLFALLISVVCFFSVRKFMISKRLDESQYQLSFLMLWFILPVLVDYFISRITPVFLNKYLLYSSIGFYMLIGFTFSTLPLTLLKKTLVIFISLILFTINTKVCVKKPEDWRSAVRYVKSIKNDDDVIVLHSACVNMPYSYYYDRRIFVEGDKKTDLLNAKKTFSSNELSEQVLESFHPRKRIIYVQSHIFNPSSDIYPIKTIQKKFTLSSKKNFGDLDVYIFER